MILATKWCLSLQMLHQCIVIHNRVVALIVVHWTHKLVLILQWWIMVIGSMSQNLLADWYIARITFHTFFFVLFFLDFWNFPSQDIDFWYWSCKSRQCLLNIKSNICCKKYILLFLVRHESGKKCADHEILLVLPAHGFCFKLVQKRICSSSVCLFSYETTQCIRIDLWWGRNGSFPSCQNWF